MNKLLTKRELVAAIGLRSPQVDYLRRRHGLPAVRIGTTLYMYHLPDVVEWLESQNGGPLPHLTQQSEIGNGK